MSNRLVKLVFILWRCSEIGGGSFYKKGQMVTAAKNVVAYTYAYVLGNC